MRVASLMTIAAAAACVAAPPAAAQQTSIIDEGGIRYQVTRQVIQRQIPVTEMRDQQQTVYRQQVTTDNVQHQQMYTVPVTQYQLVTRMHNRWNPFADPYYTYHYEPVTTWTQQVATVQIPVNRVSWAPETHTVQVPVTTYRTANEEVTHRVALGAVGASGSAATAIASTPAPSGPSATLAARPSAPLASAPPASAPVVAGGQRLQSDPPRAASGWQPPADSRYR